MYGCNNTRNVEEGIYIHAISYLEKIGKNLFVECARIRNQLADGPVSFMLNTTESFSHSYRNLQEEADPTNR